MSIIITGVHPARIQVDAHVFCIVIDLADAETETETETDDADADDCDDCLVVVRVSTCVCT